MTLQICFQSFGVFSVNYKLDVFWKILGASLYTGHTVYKMSKHIERKKGELKMWNLIIILILYILQIKFQINLNAGTENQKSHYANDKIKI